MRTVKNHLTLFYMPFNKYSAREASALATKAGLKRRGLEKDVVNAALRWVEYIKAYQDTQASWRSIHQIRLCEAVEALNEFVKYG